MDTTVKTQDSSNPEVTDAQDSEGLQPFLHDAVVTLHAPSFVISRPDGGLGSGADGFFHGDRRALARLAVTVEGVPLAPVAGGFRGAGHADFQAVLRGLGETTPDPAVVLYRRRAVRAGQWEENLEIVNSGIRRVALRLTVAAGTDLAPMEDVKSGRRRPPVPATAAGPGELAWQQDTFGVRLAADPAPAALDAAAGRLSYDVQLDPGASWTALLRVTAAHADGDQFPGAGPGTAPWRTPALHSADRRLDRWLRQSVADLDGLRLTDPRSAEAPAGPEHRADQFLAAGAPWFLTLFGRDALWAARMLLPLGTDLAAGTLRTLARRQGTTTDPDTDEQPGRILHEVRRGTQNFTDAFALPPVYYGTVDATPLWVTLLHDAWRWGLDPAEVEPLLPHAEAALAWMRDQAAADGDGFLKYVDRTGRGLANQGWKDSGDSIRHQDGRLADPPIALCEVQAYAHEAARGGAALLRAFGRPGADAWEDWAHRLAGRFRERFWVEDAHGPYPAVALDRDGRPVDAVTSAFGHLLGTGLLNDEESATLAARLTRGDLDSGHGLRTLSGEAVGFNPYGYHIGSIWPHDTAIAVHGLVRAGFPDAAAPLAAGLLEAADAFGGRLPELYAGHGGAPGAHPAPYPASCRPQAWAAASAVLVLRAALGLDADVPAGTVTLAPGFARRYGPLTVTGLQVAGARMDVEVAADGTVSATPPAGTTLVSG
ncbi:amylo-alpha-1,6-glucosidase [Streptomyces tropicalis]|uniref:Glycogen debranching N-terminal domain-containing protein n=1 Tax=Streptomyces tropicalis TaxID=3034234 RepID=A0ABT6A8Q2_9ACTN|nr:glycogen debranching N-terminal domain-containing protein [Streptomyces tropicalis]MDF3300230.1 glycogen debranching N-terminal domain-containing protein [Streptomyces tropicalis]